MPRQRSVLIGASILAVIVAIALLAPYLGTRDPARIDPVARNKRPGAERVAALRAIDTHWMNHIDEMAHLREQVAFSGYAQRDPLIEYQDQAFRKFQQLLVTIDTTIVRTLLQIDFQQFAPRRILEEAEAELKNLSTNEAEIEGELSHTGVGAERSVRSRLSAPAPQSSAPKVGRNDPCPCGSGKKFKKCHGKDV